MVVMLYTNMKNKGFTLVEMLVAVAIFSLIVGAAAGLFVSALRAQRKALATQELLSQTSYIMEYMGRAIRMAKKDDVDIHGVSINCLAGDRVNYEKTRADQGIKFRNYRNVCQEFYLEGTRIKEKLDLRDNYLTGERLKVLDFNIGPADSWDQDDNYQPRVTLFLRVQGEEEAELKIQTTISQRSPDIKR